MKGLIKEFLEFIKKGNVVDLAIAVVMGQAFSAIVNSLVNDIIMPILGLVIGGMNFESIKLSLGNVTLYYGKFLQSVVNFLIIALCIFAVVKVMNKFMKKKEEKKEEPKKADDILLLEEIRDLLKNK